jgi:hypothetical protein
MCIAVKSESLDFFTRMFTPILSAKGTADVRWETFVAAMVVSLKPNK